MTENNARLATIAGKYSWIVGMLKTTEPSTGNPDAIRPLSYIAYRFLVAT